MHMEKFRTELAQICLQTALAAMNVLIRVALARGMNQLVFVTYRQVVAAVAIAPFALIKERNQRPPLTFAISLQIFGLAFCGITLNQNLFFAGMQYTGTTFAASMGNILPACTFVMAAVLGFEDVRIRSIAGKAKVVGTLGCVSGAMVMTFYKGPPLKLLHLSSEETNRLIGSILLLGSVLCWSIWLIFQAYVVKKYPAHFTMIAIMFVWAALQCGSLAMFAAKAPTFTWTFAENMQLYTCLYAGTICSAFALCIQSWCLERKGPVFVATFNPVCAIAVAIIEITILHYALHLGSLVGAVVIVLGLYMVLWGKAKQHEENVVDQSSVSNDVIKTYKEEEFNPQVFGHVKVDITVPLLHDQQHP